MNNARVMRTAAITIGLLVVVVLVGAAIYSLAVQPRLSVTAPTGSDITITTLAGKAVVQQKASAETTIIKVNAGSYTVTIQANGAQQMQVVTAKPSSEQHISFIASPQLNSNLMVRRTAYNPVPASTGLSYLDTTGHLITTLDSSGHAHSLGAQDNSALGTAHALKPIAGGEEIALVDNKLYVLSDGQFTPIKMADWPAGGLHNLAIATNPNQDSFAVAMNQTVYWYDSPNAVPQQLLDLNKEADQLVVGGNKLVAYSLRMPPAKQDIKSSYAQFAIDPIVVDVQAKTQKVLASGPLSDASVAADGKHATLTPRDSITTTLYDLTTNQAQYSTLNSNIISPLWIDASHYIYAHGSTLWKFDITSQVASSIATLENNQQPTSLIPDPNGDGFYATTYNDKKTAAIYHLTARADDANIKKAASAATYTDPNFQYTYDFINFGHPTIVIKTTPMQTAHSQDEQKSLTQSIRDQALKHLKDAGVDVGELAIVYDPAG
jgi:hypothetical protein